MGSSRALSRTTASKKKRTRKTLLSSTRPNQLKHTKSAPISSSAGRTVIRRYHTLHKQLSTAIASDDNVTVNSLRQELDAFGGLEKYQNASFAGQQKERGGDTSEILVQWLSTTDIKKSSAGLRLLEVGALDVNNACARCDFFDGGIERIDLHSRHPEIKEQDFMQRPFPEGPEGQFDVISLSLVVNFVGDLKGRGDMLQRASKYLRAHPTKIIPMAANHNSIMSSALIERTSTQNGDQTKQLFPALFLVLPAPCVTNSRYLDEERLAAMMTTLGYSMARRKMSAKLVYYLWHFTGIREHAVTFAKEEIRKGKNRNNFAIVLR